VPRAVYGVSGRRSVTRLTRIDHTIGLSGAFVVPPFAEGHNHNLGTGSEKRDHQSIRRHLAAEAFLVKILENLPVNEQAKARLGLNAPVGRDADFE